MYIYILSIMNIRLDSNGILPPDPDDLRQASVRVLQSLQVLCWGGGP